MNARNTITVIIVALVAIKLIILGERWFLTANKQHKDLA
jgi:hypothetical protein